MVSEQVCRWPAIRSRGRADKGMPTARSSRRAGKRGNFLQVGLGVEDSLLLERNGRGLSGLRARMRRMHGCSSGGSDEVKMRGQDARSVLGACTRTRGRGAGGSVDLLAALRQRLASEVKDHTSSGSWGGGVEKQESGTSCRRDAAWNPASSQSSITPAVFVHFYIWSRRLRAG